jgi:hypothetical protein
LLKAGIEAASILRRDFDQIGNRCAPLAAYCEPLNEPSRNEGQRSSDAHSIVWWQKSDQHRPARHQHDGENKRNFASFPVADPSDRNGAQWPEDKPDPERREHRQQGCGFAFSRKKLRRDDAGKVAVYDEIIPLQHVTYDRRADGSARGRIRPSAPVEMPRY